MSYHWSIVKFVQILKTEIANSIFPFQIFEELHSIFGDDKERCPTYEELQNMPVLDRCIKEVLRMYPPGYIIARRIRREIKIGDYDIPKGM